MYESILEQGAETEVKHSEETKRKIGEANKGPASPARMAAIMKLAEARRNSNFVPWNKGVPRTPEEKEKISKTRTGITVGPFTEEHKRKIGDALRGRPVGQRVFGFKHTEETKKRLSELKKGKPLSEEHRKKLAEVRKGIVFTEERNKKISEKLKGRTITQEWRIKLSCAQRGIPVEEFDDFIKQSDYCSKFNEPFRERVRQFFDRICVECGKSEEENRQKLSVHHVNYRKDACCDPDVKLLFVPLCTSCHAKTHGKRELWQEHFTNIINEKYGGRCYLPKPTIV